MSDSLLTSKDGEVYWISLNRPEKANAINVDM
jgi:enoyl-CoA hydratase/carnithine racemase